MAKGYGRKRRGTRRGKSSVKSLARQVAMLKPEKKQSTFQWNAVAVDNAGREDTINGIVQGVAQNQRVGNKIRFTGHYARFALTFPDTTNVVRIIVYTPKNEGDSMVTDMISVTGLYDMDKYNVYYDRLFTGGANGPTSKTFEFKKSWKFGKLMTYSGAAAADIVHGRIVIFMVSDSGAAAHPAISGGLRQYYTDI